MKYCLLVITLLFTSFTPHIALVDNDNAGDELQQRHFDFASGYTTVTCYDNRVKITAEQRSSDKLLQVIVFPQDMGAKFNINNIQVGIAPPRFNLQGKVARVTGVFIAQVNETSPMRARMMVPVQISTVSEFTVSSNEALIQGNEYREISLPESRLIPQ